MDKVVVGIDVSKDKLDVCLLPQGELFEVARNAEGLSVMIERLKPFKVQVIAWLLCNRAALRFISRTTPSACQA